MKKSLILLSFLFLMGCSEIRTVPMTPKNVKKLIKEKESSKRDVQELFGEPNKMSKNADGNDLWEYKRIVNGNFLFLNHDTMIFICNKSINNKNKH